MTDKDQSTRLDAVIVGGGFAGLYMLHRLRGLGLSTRVFEAGDGVGGTWFWNRYPGARCDVESMEYSYQFSEELQQEWEWTERYASQPEILRYINHVADRFNLRGDIQLKTRVKSATFDEQSGRWLVLTDQGDQVSARFCIMATGCLSAANTPKIKGLNSFTGDTYHTGHWPQNGVDFSGKRVGIIGTGSSAIQAIPEIAKNAQHLYVFQRTPNFSVPAQNGPLDSEIQKQIKADYPAFRKNNSRLPFAASFEFSLAPALEASPEQRQARYESLWQKGGLSFIGAFGDLLAVAEANQTAADFVRDKIRAIVKDPKVADLLTPKDILGCKRLCSDTHYYQTFNRSNVSLVDLKTTPIEEVTPTGITTSEQDYPLDCLVLATGFDAMTGALLKIEIRGRSETLQQKWAAGPRTYLGLGTSGFPNLFTISGPGSPSVLTNMIVSIEQHVDWIADCISYLIEQGQDLIEATPEAENQWVSKVNSLAEKTLYPSCNSWYLGANVPGKPRVFMPYIGFPSYVEKCNQVVADGYQGFTLSALSK